MAIKWGVFFGEPLWARKWPTPQVGITRILVILNREMSVLSPCPVMHLFL